MSIRVMTDVWHDAPVKGAALLVLLALADGADDNSVCWPSVATLASKARIGRATVFRVLEELEGRGLVSREQRAGRSTLYRVHPAGDPSQNETPLEPDPPDPTSPQDETGGVSGWDPTSPQDETHNRKEPSTTQPDSLRSSAPPEDDATPEADLVLFPDPSLPASSTKRRRKPDEVWDAVMFACGVDSAQIPRSARGRYNRAVADLKDVGATADDVLHHAAVFRATWPDIRLTPNALAARWAEVSQYVPNSSAQTLRRDAEAGDLAARMRRLDEQEARP